MSLHDHDSEAEHLGEYLDEGYYDDLLFKEEFNRSKIWYKPTRDVHSDSYVIVQNSRKDNTILMLADRRKTTKFWWTRDPLLALKSTKETMEKIVKKLHHNKVRVIKFNHYINQQT